MLRTRHSKERIGKIGDYIGVAGMTCKCRKPWVFDEYMHHWSIEVDVAKPGSARARIKLYLQIIGIIHTPLLHYSPAILHR